MVLEILQLVSGRCFYIFQFFKKLNFIFMAVYMSFKQLNGKTLVENDIVEVKIGRKNFKLVVMSSFFHIANSTHSTANVQLLFKGLDYKKLAKKIYRLTKLSMGCFPPFNNYEQATRIALAIYAINEGWEGIEYFEGRSNFRKMFEEPIIFSDYKNFNLC